MSSIGQESPRGQGPMMVTLVIQGVIDKVFLNSHKGVPVKDLSMHGILSLSTIG